MEGFDEEIDLVEINACSRRGGTGKDEQAEMRQLA